MDTPSSYEKKGSSKIRAFLSSYQKVSHLSRKIFDRSDGNVRAAEPFYDLSNGKAIFHPNDLTGRMPDANTSLT
jgi:hypothetical protein